MAKKQRSRAYPAIDLRSAVQLLAKLEITIGRSAHDRDTISDGMGYSGSGKVSGLAARKIAALVHFGLLDRRKGLYGWSRLAGEILSEDGATVARARRSAFFSPALFRELHDYYRPDGRVPKLLASVLAQHGIATGARQDVARNFLESGQFAEVLDAEGLFLESNVRGDESTSRGGSFGGQFGEADEAAQETSDPQRDAGLERQKIQVSLTGVKHAVLSLPTSLNEGDINLLQMQLDFLAAQVEANKRSKVVRFRR